ncbi:MAG: MFS transporter, partial [Candidatus Omnitrophica bacterium]|nr:MFS transporter [Candidatus Omnitrophota bacterium]
VEQRFRKPQVDGSNPFASSILYCFFMAKITEILKNRNFFLLWLGQIISQFGDRLTQMALIGLIYKKAPGSAYELAKLFLFVIIPVFIIGPVAGACSDRWNKKYTMVISDFIRGVLVLLIILYCFLFPKLTPMFPIYIIVFLMFSMARFFLPAKMSTIPDIVPQDKLLLANSLINTTGMIAAVLGFSIGGIFILPIFGIKTAFFIDAATFFMSAGLLLLMKSSRAKTALKDNIYYIGMELKQAIKKSIFSEIKDGIHYMLLHKKMHFVIGILFLLWSAIGASYVVIIIFVQNALGTATKHLGLLAMFFGAGLFCGSLLYGRFGSMVSKTKAIFLSLSLSGFFIMQFVIFVAAYPFFYVAAGLAFVFGMFVSPIMISSNTIVHELMPQDLRGRAFSSLEAVMHLAFLIFMILVSILAERIDTSYILIVVGMMCIYAGALGLKKSA